MSFWSKRICPEVGGKNPEATRQTQRGEWHSVGDVAYRDTEAGFCPAPMGGSINVTNGLSSG